MDQGKVGQVDQDREGQLILEVDLDVSRDDKSNVKELYHC